MKIRKDFKITEWKVKVIEEYCIENDITQTRFIEDAISDRLKLLGVRKPYNQLKTYKSIEDMTI